MDVKAKYSLRYVLKNQQGYDFVKGDNRVLVGSKFLALPKKSTRVI